MTGSDTFEALDQSEFNSNVASLMRIDLALKHCHTASFNEEWLSYFKYLKILRKEARYKMKHRIKNGKCVPECVKCEDERLFKKLEESKNVFTNSSSRLIRSQFENKLDSYELFLREFMGKKGMLLKDATDMRGL